MTALLKRFLLSAQSPRCVAFGKKLTGSEINLLVERMRAFRPKG
jgi:hypothetical protein